MKAMLDEVGTVPGMFIIILYIAAAMDGFVIFSIMVRKIADVNEYTASVLKWNKIAVLYIAAAVILWYAAFGGYSVRVTVIMWVLCVLLLADGILSTIIKKKFGAKK